MELIGDGMFIYVESAEKLILKNNMTKSLQEFNKEKLEEVREQDWFLNIQDSDGFERTQDCLNFLSTALADQAKMIEEEYKEIKEKAWKYDELK